MKDYRFAVLNAFLNHVVQNINKKVKFFASE